MTDADSGRQSERGIEVRALSASGTRAQSPSLAFVAAAAVGVLGGMIGLGGAEFRLPLLIGVIGFVALQAVIVNKALSLVVVIAALPARALGVPYSDVSDHWNIVVNLLAGSLVGAWFGATWATQMRSRTPLSAVPADRPDVIASDRVHAIEALAASGRRR